MPSPLPCFITFCSSAIATSPYVFYTCLPYFHSLIRDSIHSAYSSYTILSSKLSYAYVHKRRNGVADEVIVKEWKKKKKKTDLASRFGEFVVQYFRDGFSRHWESSWPGKHSKMDSKLS